MASSNARWRLNIRITFLLITFFLALQTIPASSAKGEMLKLVTNGMPSAVILLPNAALRSGNANLDIAEKDAARILQEHIHQMSGASLPILRENQLGPVAIRDGRLLCDDMGFANKNFVLVGEGKLCERLGVTSRALGPGGVLSKTQGNVLVLIGHPLVSHPQLDGGSVRAAVISFLEYLGCRYLWPGEAGKVVPIRQTIAVGPIFKEFTPPIGQRRIRTLGMTDRMQSGLGTLGLEASEWKAGYEKAVETKSTVPWSVWHGLGGDLRLDGGHAFGWAWERFGKKHPEWFALQADGTRDQSAVPGTRARLCKSNLRLIEAIAADIISRVRSEPRISSVSLAPNDGGYSSFCMCDSCKALDPPNAPTVKLAIFNRVGKPERKIIQYPALTDRMVFFWNAIIERVTKEFPGLLFVIDAYSAYSTPPVERRIHPNAVLRYVPSDPNYLEGWRKMGISKVYWRPNILLTGKNSGRLAVYGKKLSDAFHQMATNGLLAVDFDSILHHWAVHGFNYYVAARLSWDPKVDYAEILEDYCQSGFGAAGSYIRDYLLLAERATGDHDTGGLTPTVVHQLRSLLEKADLSVQGDEAIRKRIRFLRRGLDFTEIQVLLDDLAVRAASGDLNLDWTEVNRLLNRHIQMMRTFVADDTLAVNTPYLTWASGNFAKWRSLGWPPPSSRTMTEGP